MARHSRLRSLRQARCRAFPAAVLAGLAACTGDQPREEPAATDTVQPSCGRLEAAARSATPFFDFMGAAAEACEDGNVHACNPGNYAFAAAAGVVYMPIGFLIGLAFPDAGAHLCAEADRRRAARNQPKTPEQLRARLWVKAAKGDAGAQFEVGEQLFAEGPGDARRGAWYWYCRAAHQGHAEAQFRLGDYHRTGRDPARRDLREAYVWYELAADQHVAVAAEARDALAAGMGANEVARAERRAGQWQPRPTDCRFETAAHAVAAADGSGGHEP